MGATWNGERYTGIQFGLWWDTEAYQELNVAYGKETVTYYQFRTVADARLLQIVPDGCVDLFFRCDPAAPSAFVCGPVLKSRRFSFSPAALYFGVRLTPRLSTCLPGLPLRELLDIQMSLEWALPNFRGLASRLAGQPDFRSRIDCFQICGLQMLRPDDAPAGLVEYCLDRMVQTNGGITVRELAMDTGFSERYLRLRFEEAIGIPPKTFGRIVRFQQTLRDIMDEKLSFMEIVSRYGYYDQAHFIKEFKAFSQLTPMQMQKRNRILAAKWSAWS